MESCPWSFCSTSARPRNAMIAGSEMREEVLRRAKTSTCTVCGVWGELSRWQMTPPQHAELTVQVLEAAVPSQKSCLALPRQPGYLSTVPEVRKGSLLKHGAEAKPTANQQIIGLLSPLQ